MTDDNDDESPLRAKLAALILQAATLFHQDPARARQMFLEARRVAMRIGDRTEAACALMGAAHIDRSSGNRVRARRLYRQIARQEPDFIPAFRTLALVETEIANDLVQTGNILRAATLYSSAAHHHRHAAALLEREGEAGAATERGLERFVLDRLTKVRGLTRG